MRRLAGLAVLVAVSMAVVGSAQAARTGTSIHGGGSANDETRFGIAINGGSGHFECLMPGVMTVQATVSATPVVIDEIGDVDARPTAPRSCGSSTRTVAQAS